MQDMIPPNRRNSIRNIPVAAGHRHAQTEQEFGTPPRRRGGLSGSFVWWSIAVILVCGTFGLLLSTVFEGATVVVYPKTQSVAFPPSITAQPNASTGEFGYQTITINQTASTTVHASGTQHVSKSASSTITIFNTYSTAGQRLIANTRFEAADGKMYRIHTAVVVPGETKKANGEVTPGSTTATIYADAPGSDYNRSTTTSFTIPGFKSDPRYTKFSAQSQGAILGGIVGDVPAVAPADLAQAGTALQRQLQNLLQSAAQASTPSGCITAQGQAAPTFTAITQATGSDNSTVILSEGASAQIVIVHTSDLAAAVAKQAVAGYSGEAVVFSNPNAITLTLQTNSITTGPLTFGLTGSSTLVWQYDAEAFKSALLGKNKASFETIAKNFEPSITKAEATIRPFWKATFPTDPSRLTIQTAK